MRLTKWRRQRVARTFTIWTRTRSKRLCGKSSPFRMLPRSPQGSRPSTGETRMLPRSPQGSRPSTGKPACCLDPPRVRGRRPGNIGQSNSNCRNSAVRCNHRPHRMGCPDDLYYNSEKSVKPCILELSLEFGVRCNRRPHRTGCPDDLYYNSEKSVKPCNLEVILEFGVRCNRRLQGVGGSTGESGHEHPRPTGVLRVCRCALRGTMEAVALCSKFESGGVPLRLSLRLCAFA